MASNKTTSFASAHPGHFLDKEGDGSNADMTLAMYRSPHLVSNAGGDPGTNLRDDGATNEEEGGGSSSSSSSSEESPVSPDSGTGSDCRPGRAAGREAMVERAWEMRRSESPVATACRLVVPPAQGLCSRRRMLMDMEEVKACKDLGLELPRDWTYEISMSERPRSAGSSPSRRWSISHPGGDPRDVKADLKVWAHAVAAASVSRLSS